MWRAGSFHPIGELAISAMSKNLLPHRVGDLLLPCWRTSHLCREDFSYKVLSYLLLLDLTSHNSPCGLCTGSSLCLEPFSPRQPLGASPHLSGFAQIHFFLRGPLTTSFNITISPRLHDPLTLLSFFLCHRRHLSPSYMYPQQCLIHSGDSVDI